MKIKNKIIAPLCLAVIMTLSAALPALASVNVDSPRETRTSAKDLQTQVDARYEKVYEKIDAFLESSEDADDDLVYDYLDLADSVYAMTSALFQATAIIEGSDDSIDPLELKEIVDELKDYGVEVTPTISGDTVRVRASLEDLSKDELLDDYMDIYEELAGEDAPLIKPSSLYAHMLFNRQFKTISLDFGTKKNGNEIAFLDAYVGEKAVFAQLAFTDSFDPVDGQMYYSVCRLLYSENTLCMSVMDIPFNSLKSIRVRGGYQNFQGYKFTGGDTIEFYGKNITINDNGKTYKFN